MCLREVPGRTHIILVFVEHVAAEAGPMVLPETSGTVLYLRTCSICGSIVAIIKNIDTITDTAAGSADDIRYQIFYIRYLISNI